MNTLGEGGMITTNDSEFMETAKRLRNIDILGEKKKRENNKIGEYNSLRPCIYDHSGESFTHDFTKINEWGNNFRMNEVQAVVGSVQLKKLDEFNSLRTKIAERYTSRLSEIEGIQVPVTTPNSKSVWHLYTCYLDTSVIKCDKNEFLYYLDNRGIQIVPRFFPVHLSDYMRYYGHQYGECPNCEKVWFEEQINLPINPQLSFSDVDYALEVISDAVKHFK
jgi:perosamine synthetase